MALDGSRGAGSSASTALEIGADGAIHVPSADFLYSATFVRSGSDLKLVGDDGHAVVIPRYFESSSLPPLIAPNDTVLTGDTVRLLAGPAYPGQYAQAGAPSGSTPIGKVVQAEGEISVHHADGTAGSLHFGDPIFENDVVETGQSTVGIRFTDGTIFSMAAGTRMVINHFVYDPDSSSNSALFNVIKGTFTMFGGNVVDTGDMKVSTPIATLGIRGSNSIGVNVDAPKGWLTTNATDPNGDLSKIEVLDPVTQKVVATLTDLFSKVVLTPNGVGVFATTPEEIATAQKLAQLLHHIYSIKPPAAPDFDTPAVKKTFFDFDDDDYNWVLPSNALFIPFEALPALHEELRNAFPEIVEDIEPPADVNDAPTADDVAASGDEDATSIPITLTGADIDAGDAIVSFTLTSLPENGTLYIGDTPAAIGVAYAASANQLTLSFVPDADFNGEVSFGYTSFDGEASSGPATATITVNPVNDVPIAVDDTAQSVAEDGASIGGNVLANDTQGPEGATLTAVDFGLGGGLQPIGASGVTAFTTPNGTYMFQPNGDWTFDPSANLNNASGIGAGFTYQITDGSGDTSTAVQAITVTDGPDPSVTQNAAIGVDEAGLGTVNATGSDASTDVETNTGTVTFQAGSDNIVGIAFTSVAGITADVNEVAGADIVWTLVGPTQIKGAIGGIDAILIDLTPPSLPIAAGDTGSATVTVTLTDNFPHPAAGLAENVINLTGITVVATDADGDTAGATVAVNVTDDVPTAVDDSGSVVQEGQDFNVAFVLDFSGSINNTELDEMLQAVRSAGEALFNGTSGDVTIRLVAFSSDAISFGPFTTFEDFSNQIEDINPMEGGTRPFNGGTNFTAGIEETIDSYVPVADAINQIIFISDGNPTEQTGSNPTNSLLPDTAEDWAAFVNDSDIGVQTIGIGDGINEIRLQDLEVDGGSPIVIEDFTDLIDTLLAAVTPDDVSGNVLGGVIDGDAFGADGGFIKSIVIDGVTYEWNGSDTITPSSGNPIQGSQLTDIATAAGGKLSFNFTTGDWSYTSPAGGVSADTTETFPYTIVDGDGDQSTADLQVTIIKGQTTADPLVLDLGEPGLELSSLGNGVRFDINADGNLDRIAWTAGSDGFLAYDLDSSGTIGDGEELFTPQFAGGSHTDGLDALASLDTHHDGTIDAADAAFDKLVVWQDANRDGVSDAGELKSLPALGITSIDLGAAGSNIFINGQAILAEGSFTYADGAKGTFVEVDFDVTFGDAEAANDDFGSLDVEYEADNRATTNNAAALAASVGFGVATAAASAAIAGPVQPDHSSASATGDGTDAASGAATDLPASDADAGAPATDPLHGIPGDEAVPSIVAPASEAASTQGLDPVDSDAAQPPAIETLTATSPQTEEAAPFVAPDGQPAHAIAASAGDGQHVPSSGATFEESKAEPLPQVATPADHDAATETTSADSFAASPAKLAERLTVLTELDTNHDGLIDANDSSFSQLAVWRDANHDGVADADELTSLADHGIDGISLSGNLVDGYLDVQSLLAQPPSGTPLIAVPGSDAQLAKLASLDFGDLLVGDDHYLDLDQALKDSSLTSSGSDGASASGPEASESRPGASSSEASQQQADAPPPAVDSGAGQGGSGQPAGQQGASQGQAAQANDGPAEAAGPNHAEAASITIQIDDGAEQAQTHVAA